ncbi:S9 family peptidase [Nannocystaceae bacterium ST9]
MSRRSSIGSWMCPLVLVLACGPTELPAECEGSGPTPSPTPNEKLEPKRGEVVEIDPGLRYRTPPDDVVAIVDAPPTPRVSVAPGGRTLALSNYPAQPELALLAAPMLGLAGQRINPNTNEARRTRFYSDITLTDVASGETRPVEGLPAAPRLSGIDWSPDGNQLAFTHTSEDRVELWTADVASARARRLVERPIDATYTGFIWLSGSERLLVHLVPAHRGEPPHEPEVAGGPLVEVTSGTEATNRTWQDLLRTPLDEARFRHYFTHELAIVDRGDGSTRVLAAAGQGKGIFTSASSSPDGRWLLVERVTEPFSRAVPLSQFGHRVELWSLSEPDAAPIVLAELPAAETVPIEGVPVGPREVVWQPLEPATLTWAEALDGGDPRKPIDHRDRLMRMVVDTPSSTTTLAAGQEFARTQHRYTSVEWLELPGRYLLREYDRDRRWTTVHLRDLADPKADRVVFDRSIHDVYSHPGTPVWRTLPDDSMVIRVDGEGADAAIHLWGSGATPKGDRPFLDRLALAEGAKPERRFVAPDPASEHAWAEFTAFTSNPDQIIVRREGADDPTDWFVVTLGSGELGRPLTRLPHPHPQLSGIDKRLLTYTRSDGVPLSATLFLPPGYDADAPDRAKLPMIVWAYPREYVDKGTAGQVRAAPTRFDRVDSTPLLFVTQGYAVLMDAAMPVVGDPETMNDTLLGQLVDAAAAAIDAVDQLGVVDRDRVGIAGHSYGAFMTANLLAHSDLFRAGIARSGAYNRTLTPFGFQSERRTLWEAPDTYSKVSPLYAADRIDEPILLIHGEIDDNPGTFPLQTERLFHALKGVGGTARMVILPHESHGYQGRESNLHVMWEEFAWFDAHVKNAGPRAAKPSPASSP